ncbi:hypothetical protein P168DRAFT_35471 [Aspergillus campestris IBT 28561]|uniref:Uncharacterized protein n=1 Tax=Aspergillus campestris (strain IBT 28561) TaxID=1392248 RepID=A0A2I1DHR0_ASPC2|nr:uncharacterized protein P168DRAFT_35471 [Aspergillus campestris IBT 28561]PKY09412.1 hypothetical protein P168DRAFT_35471 [Aspergillus campestris IBT 28561]
MIVLTIIRSLLLTVLLVLVLFPSILSGARQVLVRCKLLTHYSPPGPSPPASHISPPGDRRPRRSSQPIFTTSCYSGGWLVRPDINQQQLNTTAITASGGNDESPSWTVTWSTLLVSSQTPSLHYLINMKNKIQKITEPLTCIQFSKPVYNLEKHGST